jgi:hypothetical protein
VPGAALAAREGARPRRRIPRRSARSARNRFVGLVTACAGRGDGAGRHPERPAPRRLADVGRGRRELGLEVGNKAVAVIKATMIIVEAERADPMNPTRSASPRSPPPCSPRRSRHRRLDGLRPRRPTPTATAAAPPWAAS